MKAYNKFFLRGYSCIESNHVFMAVFFCVARLGVWRCPLWDAIGSGLFFYRFCATKSRTYKDNTERGKE